MRDETPGPAVRPAPMLEGAPGPAARPAVGRRPGATYTQLALFGFVALLVTTALEAYSIGPVPIQWLAQVGAIAFALVLLLGRPQAPAPGLKLLFVYVGWGVLLTGTNVFRDAYVELMPTQATTPYLVFVALRVVNILSFAATAQIVYWLCAYAPIERVQLWIVRVGCGVALAAIYIYIAQLYGLPEPPRTRMGTGGAGQATTFTYAFHRALGTFREPSHLAEWLVVPFFLSFGARGRMQALQSISIGAALMLTGSLTGILGAATGLAVALFMTNPLRNYNVQTLLRIVVGIVVALAIFQLFVRSNSSAAVSLGDTIMSRIEPIMAGGMGESNRDYIYDFVSQTPPPVIGAGFGHANLQLSAHLSSPLVVSFISLYFNSLYSTGVIGFAMLAIVMLAPLFWALGSPTMRQRRSGMLMIAGYTAWLVMFGVHAEELSMIFGVAFALVGAAVRPVGASAGRRAIPGAARPTAAPPHLR